MKKIENPGTLGGFFACILNA